MVNALRCLLVPAMAMTFLLIGGAEPLREYQAKGAFLVNFARFIEWSPDSFEGSTSPLVICFSGEEWIHGELEGSITGRKAGARELHLRRATQPGERCHLLFLSGESPGGRLRLAGPFTVTVGEHREFLKAGGHIRLFMDGDHIRFSVATDTARSSRFQVSSKLLTLARPQANR